MLYDQCAASGSAMSGAAQTPALASRTPSTSSSPYAPTQQASDTACMNGSGSSAPCARGTVASTVHRKLV